MKDYQKIEWKIKLLFDQVGEVNRYPTLQEFLEISNEMSKLPKELRTKNNWKKMSMKYIDFSDYFTKGLDFSDLNSIHQEILKLLEEE